MTKKDQKLVEEFKQKYPETFSTHGLELTVVKKFMKEDSSAHMIAIYTDNIERFLE